MNKIYTACVIGAGSIGALKPDHIDFPGSENILTHANALSRHSRTELVAVCDTDIVKVDQAGIKWQCRFFIDIDDVLSTMNPDIVVIATPTETHTEVLAEVLDYQPKLVIAEKPFCSNLNEAMETKYLYGRDNIPIAIDYIRRFARGYREIKKRIDGGDFGKAQNARVLYGRGLRHEGCHAIDLMRYFFGECLSAQIIRGNEIMDRSPDDLTYELEAWFDKCHSVIFQPCDGRMYGIFEIDICFEKCRLRFIDNGLYVERYPVNPENEWGHKSLAYGLTSVIRTETGLNTALYDLVDNCVNFLDGKEDLICTAMDAVKVHEVLEGLK